MRIAVLGAGGWGTAISILLSTNHHEVTLWCHHEETAEKLRTTRKNKAFLSGVTIPDSIRITSHVKEAVEGAKCVILVTPSFAVHEICMEIKPYLGKDAIIVCASKGLADEKGHRLSEMIQEVLDLPDSRMAVISGPNHAEEVGRGLPAASVVASKDPETASLVQDVFMTPLFRVYRSTDIAGVEYGGALKNIIALACGILDGLHFGDNCRAAIITRGLVEITRFGLRFGASRDTFFGLSGMGDLIVTCTSNHSRNHRAGMALATGESKDEVLGHTKMVVEGIRTAYLVYKIAKEEHISMPITEEVYHLLEGEHTASESANILMTRSKKSEFDDCR